MALLDAGLVLYVGLVFLFVWRLFFGWRCCGAWLQYANYIALLLGLVLVILVYDSYVFISVAMTSEGKATWATMPVWLRPWVLASLGICMATYLASACQTFTHIERIREDTAVVRHDRAVQIILLPAVYSVMGLSAMTRMYSYMASAMIQHVSKEEESLQLSRSETCFWVGDLYEAWALYQFGKLTLEVVESAIIAQGRSQDPNKVAAALALRISHRVVESLAWLGILSFLLVCVAQAGASLWLLTFATKMTAKSYAESMSQFTIAGFLASAAAIYNIYIVEVSYGDFLNNYYPFLKFMTVEILVTFAFVQRTLFKSLMGLGDMMPIHVQNWVNKIPLVGTLLKLPPPQFELFYAALIITECFVVCIAHYWAWPSGEEWYDDTEHADCEDAEWETKALMGAANKAYGAQP